MWAILRACHLFASQTGRAGTPASNIGKPSAFIRGLKLLLNPDFHPHFRRCLPGGRRGGPGGFLHDVFEVFGGFWVW